MWVTSAEECISIKKSVIFFRSVSLLFCNKVMTSTSSSSSSYSCIVARAPSCSSMSFASKCSRVVATRSCRWCCSSVISKSCESIVNVLQFSRERILASSCKITVNLYNQRLVKCYLQYFVLYYLLSYPI